MSIFSKLFPGGAKGESDNGNPPVDALEEGPTMKRPPSEGKSAEAVRPEPQRQNLAPASLPRGSGVRAQVAAPARPGGPARATSADQAPATHSARPPAVSTPGSRPLGSPASVRGRSSPPPRAPREEVVPKRSATPSTSPGSPGSYVSVSASRLHGPPSSPAPAPKAAPPSSAAG